MASSLFCRSLPPSIRFSFTGSSVFGQPDLPFCSSRCLPRNASASEKHHHVLFVSNSVSNVSSGNDRRHVIVTGGNSGIGKSTALELARQEFDVTLVCRSQKAGEDAAQDISRLTNNRNVRSMVCDLASLDSVRQFAAEYKDTGLPLNALVNNAGIMACPQAYTVDGFETQLGVNHLGHFLLTALLMDTLISSASERSKSRVVVLASAAHLFGDIDFSDLNYKSRAYNNWGAYGQSKLANCLFSLELAKRCKQLRLPIISNSMHPGVVDTNLIRYVFPQGVRKEGASELPFVPVLRSLVTKVLGLKTAEQGASTAVYLASSPRVRSSGLYYEDSREALPSSKARDEKLASQLWDVSVELTKSADVLAPLGLCKEGALISK
ncbi:hypothetical protein R1sor_014495 [Riccia sorocarpa]|uniref:Uncharacterized protein n=1 Tax=Riccia sorocarpa TaxID=122646 RepID=A0ABD3HBF7_9MARC